MGYELYWLLPSETPINDNGTTTVIVESLNGTMYVDFIGPVFDGWGDDIVRWAYFPDEIYAKYQNALSDVKYYKEENEKLKKDVKYWFDRYVDLYLDFRKQRDAEREDLKTKIKREFLDDYCGSVNSDGDECLTTDDLCGVCKSNDARPVGEISINELRDIFLKVMREAKERERIEEDDGK